MPGKKAKKATHKGFTLIEVMMAVTILALAATAGLKLAIMAQNTLAAVKDKEKLLAAAKEIEIDVETGAVDTEGTSGDFTWKTENKEQELFNEDFGKLTLGEAPKVKPAAQIKWKELTVSDKKKNRITVCLPPETSGSSSTSTDAEIISDKIQKLRSGSSENKNE